MAAIALAPRAETSRAAGLMIRFDRAGRIRWMNREAGHLLGRIETVADVLFSTKRPSLRSFAIGCHFLCIGDAERPAIDERASEVNRRLLELCQRQAARHERLLRAEAQLETHRRTCLAEPDPLAPVEAVEAERGRISRELHDSIGQSIAGVLLNLELAERSLGAVNAEAQARLVRSRESASAALDQIRRLSHDLYPPEWTYQDFRSAVEWLVRDMGLTARMQVDLGGLVVPPGLRPGLLTVLYRAVQEGLTNIVKHAEARLVRISASSSQKSLLLILQDDGRGFDPSRAGGIGLANIRRRINSAGGRLEIRSQPGCGAILRILVPLKRNQPWKEATITE